MPAAAIMPERACRQRPGGAAPYRTRRQGAARRVGLVAVLAAVGPVVTLAAPPRPILVWNASASAPEGLYLVTGRAPVGRGDMVIAWAPPAARQLAAGRHYLPLDVPLVKRVAAGAGARVCAAAAAILIDGRIVAQRLRHDAAGRTLPWWRGCRTLHASELFVLMADSRTSFDGRYFGVTAGSLVIGRARLLWRR
jgi:conjugative transfer signal peptidase TraF